jgi:uncharacterized protein YajQ (UPF0234 family)
LDFDKTAAAVEDQRSSLFDVNPSVAITSKKEVRVSIPMKTLNDKVSKRNVDLAMSVKAKTANVSGKAYTEKNGGYWADDAVEFESLGSCTIVNPIKQVKFQKVVVY